MRNALFTESVQLDIVIFTDKIIQNKKKLG